MRELLSSVQLEHCKHSELQELCQSVGLARYGTKQELSARFDAKRQVVLAAWQNAKAVRREAQEVVSCCKRLKKAMKRAETTLELSTVRDAVVLAKWAKRVTRQADAEAKPKLAEAGGEVERMREAIGRLQRRRKRGSADE